MTQTTISVPGPTFSTETLLRGVLGTMLALGCVSFIEPSPYELFFFLLIPVAFLNGVTITRTTVFLFGAVLFAIGAEALALMPHLDDPALDDNLKPTMFTVYSTYLWSSGLLFAVIFSRHTHARVSLALKAYAFSCVFAGIWGILSYLNIAGIGDRELIVGRVAGPFKDPNVLGSYSVLGATYFMQAMLIGTRKYRLINLAGLLITLFGGVFLSFSRGSWGATLFSAVFLIVSTYLTADGPMIRRKVLSSLAVLGLLAAMGGAMVLSNETLRSTLTDRAKLQQDYDGGVTGRFGNQLRSIPMLVERPLGFGPHRFAVTFGLDPHNSYIGAFASGGWIGGCTFIIIVLSTSFLALRLAFTASPFRRQAQVVAPALIGLFLQAVQIDVDHWRFVFLMIGLVWGLESARAMTATRPEPPRSRPDDAETTKALPAAG